MSHDLRAPNQLPIIDLQSLPTTPITTPNDAVLATAKELHRAFQETGFAYIRNHGISQTLLDALTGDARRWFAQPLADKMTLAMAHAGLAWRGYFPVGGELTANAPDQKEGIYLGTEHPPDAPGVQQRWPMHGANLWPERQQYPHFKANILQYLDDMTTLGHQLMALVALGLGLPPDYYRQRFSHEPTTLLRLFNYPQQPQGTTQWGVGEHTDMGFLTILLQDESGGLQVKNNRQEWIDAPPIPNTFVINIGDMLQHWTHGIYKASLHRVRNTTQRDRLSIPFFFDPHWQCQLTPTDKALLPTKELTDAANDPHRTRWDGLDLRSLPTHITYGDFVWSKIQHVFPELAFS